MTPSNERPDPVELAGALLARLVPPSGVVRSLVGRLGLTEEDARAAVEMAQGEAREWVGTSRREKRRGIAAFYRSVVAHGLGTVRDQLEAAHRLAEMEGVAPAAGGASVQVSVLPGGVRMSDGERELALARLRERYGDEVVDGPPPVPALGREAS